MSLLINCMLILNTLLKYSFQYNIDFHHTAHPQFEAELLLHSIFQCYTLIMLCPLRPESFSPPAANQSLGFALNAVTSCTFVSPPFLQLTKPVSLIRPVLSALTTAQSMK